MDVVPAPNPLRSRGCAAAGAFALVVLAGLAVALAWPYLPKPKPVPQPAPAPAPTFSIPQPLRVTVEGGGQSPGPRPSPDPSSQGDIDPEVKSAALDYFDLFAMNYQSLAEDVESGKALGSQLPLYNAIHDQQKRALVEVINRRAAAGVSVRTIARSVKAARGKAQ